jgi:hypothetical protein
MEILINELSLNGQFESIEYFIEKGLVPFIKILKDVDSKSNLLYKKYDFYETKITPYNTINDILTEKNVYKYEQARSIKTQLARLIENPYWEENQKQSADCVYSYNGNNICGSSLAEASERDRIAISFRHDDFLSKQLSVYKNENEIEIDNLLEQGHFTQIAYNRNLISFAEYCRKKFSESKLDFSEIDSKEGFILIKKEDEDLFFDGFRKFAELSWQQIFVDGALKYKEYNNKDYFKNICEKIYKFRISEKYRCFGYVKNGVFFVIQFDLEHKLSDLG